MTLAMAFFTFLNAWWISMLIVMPIGLEVGSHDTTVEYKAAPKRIAWRKKILQATLLAIACTAVLALLIKIEIIPLHDYYKETQ